MLISTTKLKYEKSKNKGGVLGGLGYLGGSFAAGVAGVGEGVIDAVLALGADLTGNHDFAEYVFKNNVIGDWHEDISEDYNPTGVMQFFGDVMSGIGQSSYFLIPYAGAPLFFTGVISQGISGAAEKTGDVGVKEAAYGLTTGAVEGGLEMVFGGMAKAGKTLLSGITKGTIKSTAKSAVRKGVVGQLLSGAASEFLEESASEIIDTGLQRLYKIDPNKELSMKDVLYSGLVGAVSGGVTAGVTSGLNAATNRARGEKIIKNGNAQTVVNTASYVADKLAASGTDFKNTSEWVRTLRGEVDAYNKLVEQGKGESASAHTILGEMQASLFFAETQAINAGITERIKNASEEDRAAMAEYINRNFDKKQRQKDFTAEDIAKDTNEVAKQLAIMQMVGSPFFNYDAAMADQAQESGIESVIAKEQGKATRVQSEAPTAQAAPVDAAFERAAAEGMQNAEGRMQSEAPVVEDFAAAEAGEVKHDLADDVADIESSATEIDDDIERIRGDVKKAVSGIKVDGKLYELSDKHINNIANGVQKYIRQGMSESDAIAKAVRTRLVDIKSMGEESGVKHELGKATLTKVRGAVINAYRGGMQSRTVEDAAKTAQEARKTSEGTEARKGAENVTEGKADGKAAEKSSESKNKSAETTPSTADAVPLPQKGGKAEPKVSEAKESLTDAQRAERAKKRAEAWIEWEKKTAPTAQELNTAREYVKGFDNLGNTRRLAILRTIRSAEGVDAQTVKGIANIMAVNPKSDLEFRFAEGIGNKGLTTKLGDKTVIIIDSKAKTVDALRGTIAHELVHYLETRAGYKEFAKYVRSKATAESIEEIKAKYTNHYRGVIKAEEVKKGGSEAEIAARVEEILAGEKYQNLINEEITASLTGIALQNERLLKRYAERDKSFIQKAWNWVRELAANLKKDSRTDAEKEAAKAAIKVADEYAQMMNVLLQMPTVGKADSGVKYSFSSIAYTFFGEEDMTVGEFTERDYKKTEGYKSYVEECLNNFRQSRGDSFNEAAARKEIEDGIAGIVRVAVAAKNAGYDIYDSAGQRTTRDSKQRLLFSSLEPNSDYFTSSDISTICDKRKNFTEIEAEINRIEAERGVPREKRFFSDINNFFILHDILAKHGLTTACRQCYVESMRKNLGRMANAFIDLVTETDEGNKKNKQLYNNKGEKKSGNAELRRRVRELMADEGLSDDFFTFEMLTDGENLSELRLQHPLLFEAYNSFYGQSKPKMPKSATPFRFGELTALLTDHNGKINQRLLKLINSTGGFRLQSYSDFQIKNYVDVLQVIFEAGTLGLNGHAYTKVPAFLDATEGTNLKRNISIFMYRDGDEWKIDRNDSFPWALDRIYDIVNADKSGDTGIIAVSQNEDMSAWIMANDNVGYGIPFHKSGTKMAVVRETVVKTPQGDVKGYLGIKDHTKYQSEVYASGESKCKKVKAPINIYEFWDFNNTRMSRKNLIEKNVKKYIDECERLGYLPKFRDYVINNEKVLQATLAYAKKLGYADANATVEDISFKYKGYTIPYGYYKFLVDFGVFTPEGKASPVKALSLKDYNFDKAVSFFSDSKKLRINELLQQIANGEERDKYRKLMDEGKMTIAELGKVIKDKRDAVVAEVVGETKYDLADDMAEEKAEKKADETLNENGEVKDEYWAAAVQRGLEAQLKAKQNTVDAYKEGNKTLNEKLSAERTLYDKLLSEAADMQDRIAFLERQNEAYKEGNENLNRLLSKARKKAKETIMQLEELRSDMRMAGYDFEASQRKVAAREKQIEKQKEIIRELKRDAKQKERERQIEAQLEAREAAIIAERYAKEKAELGRVFKESEVKKEIRKMLDEGLVADFFAGNYKPDLSPAQINVIARYIALQLNRAGTAEGKQAQQVIYAATNDILKRITFTEEEDGKVYHLDKIADEETVKYFSDAISGRLESIFKNIGTLNSYAQLRREYDLVRQEYLDKNKQAKERQEWGKELPKTYQAALKIKKLAAQGKGSFSEAVQLVANELGKMVDESGHLHFGRIDAAMGEVARFFEGEAMKADSERGQLDDKAKVADDGVVWSVNPALQEKVEEYLRLRKGREGKALTAEELKLVGEVLRGMKTTIERYNKEFINGHWVDVETISAESAEDLLSFVAKDKEYKTKVGEILGGKIGKKIDQFYFYNILSPETVIEALEGYKQGGLLKSLYHSVRVAKQKAEHRAVQMKKPFAEFLDDKKHELFLPRQAERPYDQRQRHQHHAG